MACLIRIDRHSNFLSKFFKFKKEVEINIPKYIDLKDFNDIYNKLIDSFKEIKDCKLIISGSNKYHHLSLFLSKFFKVKRYLLIDQHPDDFSLKNNINSGSFVRYLKTLAETEEIYYVGFIKPESEEFTDYILIEKDKRNIEEVINFIKSLKNNIYVSIDLDIIYEKHLKSFYNNYPFLLNLNEFFEIVSELRNKILKVDIFGFRETKDTKGLLKVITKLNNIVDKETL